MTDRFRIRGPGDSALVVVDVQAAMMKALPKKVVNKNLCNMRLLVEAANRLDVPILVTEHYAKGLGKTVPALEEVLGDARVLEKIVFSCSGAPGFVDAVKATGRSTVVLIGTETHVCVLQTALDLMAEGLDVHLPSDAVLSRFREDWQGGLDLMRDAGVVVTRSETVVFEWLDRADNPAFKPLQPLIKNRNADDLNFY